jgi:predicted phosphodiesterase
MNIKTQVINARNNGYTYSQITEEFGIAKSTAQGWVNSYNDNFSETAIEFDTNKCQPYINDNLQRDQPKKFRKNEDEVLEFLSQLAPIKVSPRYEIPSDITLSDYAVVGSDFHFGCHDQKAIDIFLETIFQLKPKTVILNGDTMDFLAISKYPKDLKQSWSLQKEREDYHAFLDEVVNVSGGADIFETVSNHSGQSIGGRWRRYLSDRLGELASLPDITELLSYEKVFMGDYVDSIKHVDFVDLNGLIVTHGDTVRKNGGYSARGEIDKWHTSILHGHTHRIGSSCQRIPAIGNREEQQLYGFEGGCLCDLNALYARGCNWQQGFNIVGYGGAEPNVFSVEQVLINNGKANIGVLGATIKSN